MYFDIYVICFLFLVGLVLGTFAITIGLKLPIHSKHLNVCSNCKAHYKWYEFLPFVSYLMMKGKCKYCHQPLAFSYSVYQMVCCMVFPLAYIFYGFSYEMIVFLLMFLLAIIIYVSDFRYYIISTEPLVGVGLIVLVLKYVFFGKKTFFLSLISGILIFLFMCGVRLLGNILFKRESIGGGDIKLAAVFGIVFGVRLAIVSLIIGSFLAFPGAIYYSLAKVDKEIPFGPYLITGLLVTFLFMEPIRSFLTILF